MTRSNFSRRVSVILSACLLTACDCEKYASEYSCPYVEKWAEYEVWYWQNLEDDRDEDNRLVGHSSGLAQCEETARAFAQAIDEPFNYRAYICVLVVDGKRMEKHRNLIGVEN